MSKFRFYFLKFRKKVYKEFESVYAKYMLPRKCICFFCNKKFHNYLLHGINTDVSRKYRIPCMGERKGGCPWCGSIDKHRWLWWVIENKTHIKNGGSKILHFAPEQGVMERLKMTGNDYHTGDIVSGRAELVVDMTNMNFEDETFDYIIASMVLEHITDEESAIKEILRVLKVGGKAILTVPIALDLKKTIEDSAIKTDEERLQNYGQEDHVRLYGMDIVKRWMRYGCMNVEGIKPEDYLTLPEIEAMGIPREYFVWIISK